MGCRRLLALGLAINASHAEDRAAAAAEREEVYSRYLEFPSLIRGGVVEPHWMADGSSFWYVHRAPGDTGVHVVDPESAGPTPLIDIGRLKRYISEQLDHAVLSQDLPFESLRFLDDTETAVMLEIGNQSYVLQLDTYDLKQVEAPSGDDPRPVARTVRTRLDEPPVIEILSPDRAWFLGVKGHNLWLRPTSGGSGAPLTTDGVEGHEWVEKAPAPGIEAGMVVPRHKARGKGARRSR